MRIASHVKSRGLMRCGLVALAAAVYFGIASTGTLTGPALMAAIGVVFIAASFVDSKMIASPRFDFMFALSFFLFALALNLVIYALVRPGLWSYSSLSTWVFIAILGWMVVRSYRSEAPSGEKEGQA